MNQLEQNCEVCWRSIVQEDLSAGRYSAISRELLKLAIAKRCRLNKFIRQRFALTLKDSADEERPAVAQAHMNQQL
ncbi:hypothetical protein F511_45110 [Dorcoceras hygrometricum]|uniref:Uncharacterized protein n=1 Tax=Dorcoceras hygrometricum TaxID=472368 RepID=A0A2Z7A4F4_9LAMI|nr:hypothetical protein F511_45110 [Dorcoceras hygrometricum]